MTPLLKVESRYPLEVCGFFRGEDDAGMPRAYLEIRWQPNLDNSPLIENCIQVYPTLHSAFFYDLGGDSCLSALGKIRQSSSLLGVRPASCSHKSGLGSKTLAGWFRLPKQTALLASILLCTS